MGDTHPITPVLSAQIESILYAAGEPASISAIAAALDASSQDIETALDELNVQCQSRGIRLQRHGNEVQLVTAPEVAERIQKFLGLEATNRLSTAALETLAIIAYKQPITKPQIEMIRGVNCDGVMKTLEMHNLIKELGRAETVGHPMRYGVSFEFLQHFGLHGVNELPPIDKLEVLPAGEEVLSSNVQQGVTDGHTVNENGSFPASLAESALPVQELSLQETSLREPSLQEPSTNGHSDIPLSFNGSPPDGTAA
ncbi:MAG: SMC-Scp complex subunit ScpB [Chloroflexi bacterium]|nr:SMC-Scp complex subunit ScpB [Chloroflexota bacterium]